MQRTISILLIAAIIFFPLVRFYQRSGWTKKQSLLAIIVVIILFPLTYAPFHELCHIIAAKVSNTQVVEYQLFSKFDLSGFQNAYIRTSDRSVGQGLIITTSPYVRDLILCLSGYFILRRKQIRHPLLVGVVFAVFMLFSVFDVIDNFIGYIAYNFGDWAQISHVIGNWATCIIGILSIGITIYLTGRVFIQYKGFPERVQSGSNG